MMEIAAVRTGSDIIHAKAGCQSGNLTVQEAQRLADALVQATRATMSTFRVIRPDAQNPDKFRARRNLTVDLATGAIAWEAMQDRGEWAKFTAQMGPGVAIEWL